MTDKKKPLPACRACRLHVVTENAEHTDLCFTCLRTRRDCAIAVVAQFAVDIDDETDIAADVETAVDYADHLVMELARPFMPTLAAPAAEPEP